MALVSDGDHLIAFALCTQPQMHIQMTCVSVALEIGPQPHGVVRADIYIIMKEAVDLTIDWIHKFNSGTVRPKQLWFIFVCCKCVIF